MATKKVSQQQCGTTASVNVPEDDSVFYNLFREGEGNTWVSEVKIEKVKIEGVEVSKKTYARANVVLVGAARKVVKGEFVKSKNKPGLEMCAIKVAKSDIKEVAGITQVLNCTLSFEKVDRGF